MSGVFFGWLFLMAAFTTYGWRCRRREGRCLVEGPGDGQEGSRRRGSRVAGGRQADRRLGRGRTASAETPRSVRSDGPGAAGPQPPLASPPDSAVDRLQRRFVGGELTLLEYEAELDALVERLGRRAFSPVGRRT